MTSAEKISAPDNLQAFLQKVSQFQQPSLADGYTFQSLISSTRKLILICALK